MRIRYRIASGSGKYIGFGLIGTARTTIIVDIVNIIQTVQDSGIHLKGYSRRRAEKQ